MTKRSSKLLLDESPLQMLPSLAVLLGDREAIFIQQLHFKLYQVRLSGGKDVGIIYNDQPYYYNSVQEWQRKEFPFWSLSTTRRIIARLGEGYKGGAKGSIRGLYLVIARRLPVPAPIKKRTLDDHPDQTHWYSIDYDRFEDILLNGIANEDLLQEAPSAQNEQMGKSPSAQNEQMAPFAQNEQTPLLNLTRPYAQNEQMLKESESSSESPTESLGANFGPQSWQMVLSQLRMEMRRADYDTWIAPLIFQKYDNLVVHIGAINAYGRDWVASRLSSRLCRLIEPLCGQPVTVQVNLISN